MHAALVAEFTLYVCVEMLVYIYYAIGSYYVLGRFIDTTPLGTMHPVAEHLLTVSLGVLISQYNYIIYIISHTEQTIPLKCTFGRE